MLNADPKTRLETPMPNSECFSYRNLINFGWLTVVSYGLIPR